MEGNLEIALSNLAPYMDNRHGMIMRGLSFSLCWLRGRDLSKRQPQLAMASPSKVDDHLRDVASRVLRVPGPEKLPS